MNDHTRAWPSREEWAKWYPIPQHEEYDLPVSNALSSYANKEEILNETDALKSEWRYLGREMQYAKQDRRSCLCLREKRKDINSAPKALRENRLPNETFGFPLLEKIKQRRNDDYRHQLNKYVADYAAEHVPDDAAWEKELQRRRHIDAWRGRARQIGLSSRRRAGGRL